MAIVGSDEAFLRFYESYARSPIDEINMAPRQRGDFRERIERETIRGRLGIFHRTLEEYIYRHWRGFTVPRVLVFWIGSLGFMQNAIIIFHKTFPNLMSYSKFSEHPNYKLLGPGYSWFYLFRGVFWSWVFLRMTRFLYYMVKRHY